NLNFLHLKINASGNEKAMTVGSSLPAWIFGSQSILLSHTSYQTAVVRRNYQTLQEFN
ncbi:hypothetical protein RUM43_010685, partial [Polyplax serrata]